MKALSALYSEILSQFCCNRYLYDAEIASLRTFDLSYAVAVQIASAPSTILYHPNAAPTSVWTSPPSVHDFRLSHPWPLSPPLPPFRQVTGNIFFFCWS